MLRIYKEWLTHPERTTRGTDMQKNSCQLCYSLLYDIHLAYIDAGMHATQNFSG